MPRLKPQYRTTRAKTERPCPRCGTPIRRGDLIQETDKIKHGRKIHGELMWAHVDCRGRDVIERQKAAAATRPHEQLEWK